MIDRGLNSGALANPSGTPVPISVNACHSMWLAHVCTIHLISEKIQFFLRPRRLQSLEMPLLVGIICECKLSFQDARLSSGLLNACLRLCRIKPPKLVNLEKQED